MENNTLLRIAKSEPYLGIGSLPKRRHFQETVMETARYRIQLLLTEKQAAIVSAFMEHYNGSASMLIREHMIDWEAMAKEIASWETGKGE